MEKKFSVECNLRLLVQGGILAAFSVMGPWIIRESWLGIYASRSSAMMNDSCFLLLVSAIKLVAMNVVRTVPHYLGAFLMNEAVRIRINGRKRFSLNVVITLSLIVLIYDLIYRVHGIRYDLGIPVLLIIGFVLLLSYMNLFSVSMLNKLVLVGSLLMSIQWLDVIPSLTPYGFGRGEISMDVKVAAQIMEEGNTLLLFACCMCLAFFIAAMIQVQLLNKEHKLRISNEHNRIVEKELYDTQIEALKMRNASEVQSLVHDLKSPLTTAHGLASLAEMMEENALLKEYLQKISSSLTSMDMMISEILYENRRSEIQTAELMQIVLAQVSILVPKEMLTYENRCPEAVIMGNKICLSRAIINLINNAYNAVDKETGKISITVERRERFIYITVLDNGSGIEKENMACIWDIGYSGRHSTGLGLGFAKQVVENHGGSVWLESEKGKYTRATICLREGKDEYGEQENDSGH